MYRAESDGIKRIIFGNGKDFTITLIFFVRIIIVCFWFVLPSTVEAAAY